MKKLLLMTAALGLFTGAFAKKVKFQVDMTGQTVSSNGVHIAGNFQQEAGASGNWKPNETRLTNGGSGNIYSVVVDVIGGRNYEFKFINGNDWNLPGGSPEDVPALSRVGHPINKGDNGNRWAWIDSAGSDTMVMPAFLFAGAAPAGKIAVRFGVDLQKEASIAADGVFIAGAFTNWGSGQRRMVNLFSNNKIYEHIAILDSGVAYPYKFKNGDNGWESVPSACEVGTNREVKASASTALNLVCINSCIACPTAPLPRYRASFIVDMSSSTCFGGFDSVTVAGNRPELTNWTTGARLNKMGNTDMYVAVIEMDSGEAKFKFRNHKNNTTNWEGGGDRVWVLSADDTLDLTCFGSRTVGPCPSKPAPSKITFTVDLSDETPDGQGRIYVMGTFTQPSWQSGAIRLTPVSGKPGFYSTTINDVCPGTFDYKFVNGDSSNVSSEESFADTTDRACTVPNGIGGWNRTYTRTSANDVTLAYVFSSCKTANVGLLKSNAVLQGINVYPNPTEGNVTVSFQEAGNYQVVVRDITGKTLVSYQDITADKLNINKNDITSGILLVQVTNQRGETKIVKLVVQ
ncbi:MAG: T9SS type A sorting domain-containing protein [Bacteroidia bacterium]|nr:T9SS type A sorting domain-containing protein [Bacteroidia bacterium]